MARGLDEIRQRGCPNRSDQKRSGALRSDRKPLRAELRVYRKHLPDLLADENKFVVIHGETIRAPFDTYELALQAGYDEFGLKPFLVKQIRKKEPIYFL
jgi:hypothetical protein